MASANIQLDTEGTTAPTVRLRLETRLRAEHPYELPEIVAVDVHRGSAAFFDWVDEATRR